MFVALPLVLWISSRGHISQAVKSSRRLSLLLTIDTIQDCEEEKMSLFLWELELFQGYVSFVFIASLFALSPNQGTRKGVPSH